MSQAEFLFTDSAAATHPARLAVLLWALSLPLLLGSCSSATVIRQRTTPRVDDGPAESVYAWRPGRGWLRPSSGEWGDPDHVRGESQRAFDAGYYADALHGFEALRRKLPPTDSGLVDASFKVGECYYRLGRYDEALEAYGDVYKQGRPSQEVLEQVFQRIHDIAMDFLHGAADCSFLGIRYDCPRHGAEILGLAEDSSSGLLTDYPYLPFADDAIMEVAKYYFDSQNYEEAKRKYERIVQGYPNSEWREFAQYQSAMCSYLRVRGIDYDQSLILGAERGFRQYLEDNPRGPRAEDARGKLKEITEMLGAGYLSKVQFYLRDSQLTAAKIYLRLVLEKYPTSSAASEAREIERQIEKVESAG